MICTEERELRVYWLCAEAACGLKSPFGLHLDMQRTGTLGIHGGEKPDAVEVCERLRQHHDVGVDVLTVSRRLRRLDARSVLVLEAAFSGHEREWFAEQVPEGLAVLTWKARHAYAAAVDVHEAKQRAAQTAVDDRRVARTGRALATILVWWRVVQRIPNHAGLVCEVRQEARGMVADALRAYRGTR